MKENFRLESLETESRNQASMGIDNASTQEIIETICREDQKVIQAVVNQSRAMTDAVEVIVASLKSGGRLFYMGSGTSGRLGILDAAELLPTYGVGEDTVKAIIAGGKEAMFMPIEKAEDDYEAGISDLLAESPKPKDVLVGISASGRTPYVMGALTKAKAIGMATIGLTCNSVNAMSEVCDILIAPVVGPEVVTGSTRMKAGTAQKIVLNSLSTAAMIRLGKVYQNLMVDMQPTNEKLRYRAVRIVVDATDVDTATAHQKLDESGWNIKTAIVMIKANCNKQRATQLLLDSEGFVTRAIEQAT